MKKRSWVAWILVGDLLWMATAFAGSVLLRYGLHWSKSNWLAVRNLIPFAIFSALLWVAFSVQVKLDGFRGGWHFPAVVSRIIVAVGVLMAFLLATGYALHEFVSRLALAYFGALLLIGFIFVRYCTRQWLNSQYGKGYVS